MPRVTPNLHHYTSPIKRNLSNFQSLKKKKSFPCVLVFQALHTALSSQVVSYIDMTPAFTTLIIQEDTFINKDSAYELWHMFSGQEDSAREQRWVGGVLLKSSCEEGPFWGRSMHADPRHRRMG